MESKAKRRAFVSLLFLVPFPSIGVLFGMILMPGTLIGQRIFFLSKVWILLFPASWFFFVERGHLQRWKTKPGGMRMGLTTGFAISAIILTVYLVLGRRVINTEMVHEIAAKIGLARKFIYLSGALYWASINSIIEEYVWRWFVVRQCAKLMKPGLAILIPALCFTLHHILAMQVFFNWSVTIAAGLAIAFGGALWSWMFLRYKTIFPGWLSHALVDITIFALGYELIFH